MSIWPWTVIVCGLIVLFAYPLRDVLRQFLSPGATGKPRKARATTHDGWMPVVVTLLVLLAALYIILSNSDYGEAQQKWAFGAVGTVLGYWFKR